jgi:hypothetical protein
LKLPSLLSIKQLGGPSGSAGALARDTADRVTAPITVQQYSKDVFRVPPKIMPSIQKSEYVAFPEGIPICEGLFLAFSFSFV